MQEEPAGGRAARGRSRYGDPFPEIEDLFDPSQLRRLFEREPERPRVFLQAEATPQRPFVGEQVLFTIYLYTREDITAIAPTSSAAAPSIATSISTASW